MGCGISSEFNPHFNDEIGQSLWNDLEKINTGKGKNAAELICLHSTWKTVRLFVISTFKDFRNERDIIHDKVVPPLRAFCEKKKIILIVEDFNWGRTDELMDPGDVQLLLDAMEQGYADNGAPFYIQILGECAGYIPPFDSILHDTAMSYGVVLGLSLQEIMINTGAFRSENPNALLYIRDPAFMADIPFHRVQFIEDGPGRKRVNFLKHKVMHKFKEPKLIKYHCKAEGITSKHNQFIKLKNLGKFGKSMAEFLKHRIEDQYPLDTKHADKHDHGYDEHDLAITKLNSHTEPCDVIDAAVKQLHEAILTSTSESNLIILTGDYGCGKSTVMAKVVKMMKDGGEKSKKQKLFYHFTQETPGGAIHTKFLARLLTEVFSFEEDELPMNGDDLWKEVMQQMTSTKAHAAQIFVDDVDTMDTDQPLLWIPAKIAPKIKLILSSSINYELVDKLGFGNNTSAVNVIQPQYLSKEDSKALLTYYMHPTTRGLIPGGKMKRPKTGRALNKRPGSRPATSSSIQLEANHRPLTTRPMTARTARKKKLVDDLVEGKKRRHLAEDQPKESSTLARIATAGLKRAQQEEIDEDLDAEPKIIDEEAEIGTVKSPDFTISKCKILATMARFGTSLEKVRNLASQNLTVIANAELQELEKDQLGHLLIATLCLLAASKHGLREIELRTLLANEHHLMPSGFKRKGTRFGFDYPKNCPSEVQAIRWRYVCVRLKHHLLDIGLPGENRLAISSNAIVDVVNLRYFSTPQMSGWWHTRLGNFFFKNDGLTILDRKAEEVPYHYATIKSSEKLAAALCEWEIIAKADKITYRYEIQQFLEEISSPSVMEKVLNDCTLNDMDSMNIRSAADTLAKRCKAIGHILADNGSHDSAYSTLQKAIEIEKGLLESKADKRAQLVAYCAHILHQKYKCTDGMTDWAENPAAGNIPGILEAHDTAIDALDKGKSNTKHPKKIERILAKTRLNKAFWSVWNLKLNAENAEDGLEYIKELEKELKWFESVKNYNAQIMCLVLKAHLEIDQTKVHEIVERALKLVEHHEGKRSLNVIKIYLYGAKLIPNEANYFSSLADEVRREIFPSNRTDFEEKRSVLMQLFESLVPTKQDQPTWIQDENDYIDPQLQDLYQTKEGP